MLDQPAAAHPALDTPAPQASRRSQRRGTQCEVRPVQEPGGCLDGGGRPGASTMRRAGAQQHPSRGLNRDRLAAVSFMKIAPQGREGDRSDGQSGALKAETIN